MAENEIGYCGLRRNNNGRIVGVSSTTGKLSWYHDPLPTNCVADWVCPAGTGAGYPKFANRCGAETVLELKPDPQTKMISIRSASRRGYFDLGVNRRRVENLRKRLKAAGIIR